MIRLDITPLRSREAFAEYHRSDPVRAERLRYEAECVAAMGGADHFGLDGFCIACEQRRTFLVDRLFGSVNAQDGWLPNWRERLVCPSCGLNNRQRAMLHAVRQAVADRPARPGRLRLYAMEQVSPFFRWIEATLKVKCVGSEYLGADSAGLKRWRLPWAQIRHEDAEALSFRAGRFDFVVSNDVLEHVNQPQTAIAEMHRVLKPAGEVFISVPFQPGEAATVRRAAWSEGKVTHLLPAQYHANPLSEQGSLVFHDFGWDLLDWLRAAGFADACMSIYWSSDCGYLGEPQYFFHAVKPVT